MKNYEYLIAGLPEITLGWKGIDGMTEESVLEEIRQSSSDSDNKTIDFFLEGYQEDRLGPEFYSRAIGSKNGFIREYFLFDLNVRNAKVRYLNKSLGRKEDTDIFMNPEGEFEEAVKLDAILNGNDILERERGIDALMWEKIDSLTVFEYFNINAVLGFIARLHIVYRWLKLDPESGRKMFVHLVEQVRGSYTGVRQAADEAVK